MDVEKPRILISRLSHLGDCILTVPMANALRDQFPESFIVWAVESPGHHVLERCPSVDEVMTIPRGWLKSPRTIFKLRRQLQSMRFDVSIDPQSLTKSSALAWISGAKTRIGLKAPLGRELSTWLNNRNVAVSSRHVVDRSLEMLEPLGVDKRPARFDFNVPESVDGFADEALSSIDVDPNQFFVINPGAGWESRQWCNRRFGEVASIVGRHFGLKSVVTWFGDAEDKMAKEICANSDGFAIQAPATRIWELAGIMRRSRFYLGCDTGPTHLAAALGVRCAVLFGTTEPEVSGPYETNADQLQHIRIQKYYQSGSSRERRNAGNVAMLEIEVEDVLNGIESVLNDLDPARVVA